MVYYTYGFTFISLKKFKVNQWLYLIWHYFSTTFYWHFDILTLIAWKCEKEIMLLSIFKLSLGLYICGLLIVSMILSYFRPLEFFSGSDHQMWPVSEIVSYRHAWLHTHGHTCLHASTLENNPTGSHLYIL